MTLVARTVALDPNTPLDLLAVAGDDGVLFEREDVGLAGRGEALRIELPYGLGAEDAGQVVAEALASIEVEDEVGLPGCGPVAIGALPFTRSAPGSLVVPAFIAGRSPEGTTWVTRIGAPNAHSPALEQAPVADAWPPDAFALDAAQPHETWCKLVAETIHEIRSGAFEKVVLAREVVVTTNRPIIPSDVLGRLRALYPSCMVFSVDGFVGASPELLVRRFGSHVRAHPLAGTVARSGDPEADERLCAELLGSAKNRHEHRVVVAEVAAALQPLCETIDVPGVPSIVPLRNVSHLGTLIEGTLRDGPTAFELAALLHPTPAVAGRPRKDAVAYIAEREGFDRGRYAGPVGWVDGRGDGVWAVGIRSADLSGNRARLVSGVGVMADSTPEAELVETQLKLQALLAAVVRP
ncbi:MAG: menaquinone-specific isochorismate synthase [Acidimicrobiaceae bacterium]|nr:menaquinone-specific isochorismate synthase [Acidimicrobiaceae bacterium]